MPAKPPSPVQPPVDGPTHPAVPHSCSRPPPEHLTCLRLLPAPGKQQKFSSSSCQVWGPQLSWSQTPPPAPARPQLSGEG